jgi:hypothetical protein
MTIAASPRATTNLRLAPFECGRAAALHERRI